MISNPDLKKSSKTKILILGRGFIGTSLWFDLLDHDPILANREHVDYHDISVLRKYLFNNGIDVVINAFGFTGTPNVDEAEEKKELCWRLNTLIPLNINRLCNDLGVKYIHISSGCIFDGYDKVYDESDTPNFGLFDTSSFYSKSKHAFEYMAKDMNSKILRVRMPLCISDNPRNFIVKIKKYDNVISFVNSKTFLKDLGVVVRKIIDIKDKEFWCGQDVYNVVNSNPLSTEQMMEMMKKANYFNPNWKLVDVKDLNLAAPRSNCVLDNSKIEVIHKMRDEADVVGEALWNITGK